jgi:hypothetical protein
VPAVRLRQSRKVWVLSSLVHGFDGFNVGSPRFEVIGSAGETRELLLLLAAPPWYWGPALSGNPNSELLA